MAFANVGVPPLRVVMALFAVTGFSALCLQVVWQRVISIHGGVDLFSSATVVAAFMAGLGLGNLLGGALADRLGPNRSILAFAVANLGIGLFGWVSIAIFYDGYRALVQHIASLPAAFAFHFVLLVVPTTLMGLSLPLLSRGVVRDGRRGRARREPPLCREHARRRGRGRHRRLVPARQSRFRRHRAPREQPEHPRGGRGAAARARGARASGARRFRPRLRPAAARARRGVSGRGSRCTRRRGLPRSRSRSSTSGSSTASCARIPTRSRTCSRCI